MRRMRSNLHYFSRNDARCGLPHAGDEAVLAHGLKLQLAGQRRLDDRNLGTGIDHEFVGPRMIKTHICGHVRAAKSVVSYWHDVSRALGFPDKTERAQDQERERQNLPPGIHRSSPQPQWLGELCWRVTALS